MGGKTVLYLAIAAFVIALAGTVNAAVAYDGGSSRQLPCWDNACADGTFFAGCCDTNSDGKYERSECASDAAYDYITSKKTLEQACAESVSPPKPPEKPNDISESRFTLKLRQGWNLVSVPVANYMQVVCKTGPCYAEMPANLVSNTCQYGGTKVFFYDREAGKYADQTARLYEKIYPGGGFRAGYSYWVKVPQSCEMAFSGTHRMVAGNAEIYSALSADLSSGQGWSLSTGWNNVGSPAQNTELEKVSSSCDLNALWRFNAASRKWEKAEVLKPGEGYFVKARKECTLGLTMPLATPTPAPVSVNASNSTNASPGKQLTFTKDTVYNLIDFVNSGGRRLAIYWKRATDGMDFGDGSIESLDVDSGAKTTLTLHDGLAWSDGRYLTYIDGNCVRFRDYASNAEKTAACGEGGHVLNGGNAVAASGKIFYKDEYFEYPPLSSVPYDVQVTYPVYEYDISTGTTREAFRVNKDFHASSDGRTLAWFDVSSNRRTASGSSQNTVFGSVEGERALYYYSQSSGSVSRQAVAERPNYAAVTGNLVYYSAGWAPGNGLDLDYNAVHVYDAASRTTRQLTQLDARASNLDADAGILVWHASGSSDDDQVYLYSPSLQAIRRLTSGAVFHSTPKLLGNSLVYSGGGSDWKSNNLFLLDFAA